MKIYKIVTESLSLDSARKTRDDLRKKTGLNFYVEISGTANQESVVTK